MSKQRLQQKHQQNLSPLQIQFLSLLQIPIVSLEKRIEQELEENPALEEDENQEEDIEIASGSPAYWSFPGWPSHLDHILITDELFQSGYDTQTLLIEETFFPDNPFLYDFYISDHRPVGIRFQN